MTDIPENERLIDSRTPGHAAHAAPDDGGLVVEPMPESPPVEANLQPRPEPVLDAARIGGLIAALVVAVAATVSLVLAGKWTDINALGVALGGVAGAVMALIAYVAPVWQARKAREKVTPLADPRDALLRKLTAR